MGGSLRTGFLAAWLAIGLLAPAGGRADESRPVKVLIAPPISRFLSARQSTGLAEHMRMLAGRYGNLQLVGDAESGPGCKGKAPSCWVQMGKRLGADRVVLFEFQKLPFRFVVSAELLDVVTGKSVSRFHQRVRGRPHKLDKLVSAGWTKMFGPVVDSFIRVTANTLGAEVLLNGALIGKTPVSITRSLGAGQHAVTVQHPGYQPQTRTLAITPGKRQYALQFKLERMAAPGPDEPVAALVLPEAPGPRVEPPVVAGIKVTGAPEPAGPSEPEPVEPTGKIAVAEAAAAPEKPAAIEVETIEAPAVETATSLPAEDVSAGTGFIYKQWWFWTSVAAVLVAGLTTTVLLGSESQDVIPAGKGRVTLEF